MQITSKSFRTGTLSFIIVLLFIPLGHALMVLNEKLIPEHKFLGAAILGFTGLFYFSLELEKMRNHLHQLF